MIQILRARVDPGVVVHIKSDTALKKYGLPVLMEVHQVHIQTLQMENKKLLKQHARERAPLGDEHASAIANQRQELTEVVEQAENRLMMLLDQERQGAKTARKNTIH